MSVLPLLAGNAIVMMAAALAMTQFGSFPPQVAAHVAFAIGILPLILAAIAYFVPVLTRSSGAPPSLHGVPLLAWLGGTVIVAGFAGILGLNVASHAAFALAETAAIALLVWAGLRAKHTLGRPHPGVNWYLAALACLALALLAVPAMTLWPMQRTALRLFHLHLNLLGFVGLTAIGTLQVLLPTAAGQVDPGAGQRLSADLKFALSGVILIAYGSAWFKPLAIFGALLFLIAPLRMLSAWLGRFADRIVDLHGAAPSLALACLGLLGLLGGGIAHACGIIAGRAAIVGFVIAFLLPLVSGAVTQLLPVWLRPGPQREWHSQLRDALGRLGGLRALLMVSGGLGISFGWEQGIWLALSGLALLALTVAQALWFVVRLPRQPSQKKPKTDCPRQTDVPDSGVP